MAAIAHVDELWFADGRHATADGALQKEDASTRLPLLPLQHLVVAVLVLASGLSSAMQTSNELVEMKAFGFQSKIAKTIGASQNTYCFSNCLFLLPLVSVTCWSLGMNLSNRLYSSSVRSASSGFMVVIFIVILANRSTVQVESKVWKIVN